MGAVFVRIYMNYPDLLASFTGSDCCLYHCPIDFSITDIGSMRFRFTLFLIRRGSELTRTALGFILPVSKLPLFLSTILSV